MLYSAWEGSTSFVGDVVTGHAWTLLQTPLRVRRQTGWCQMIRISTSFVSRAHVPSHQSAEYRTTLPRVFLLIPRPPMPSMCPAAHECSVFTFPFPEKRFQTFPSNQPVAVTQQYLWRTITEVPSMSATVSSAFFRRIATGLAASLALGALSAHAAPTRPSRPTSAARRR
jgi:hypothetical protein